MRLGHYVPGLIKLNLSPTSWFNDAIFLSGMKLTNLILACRRGQSVSHAESFLPCLQPHGNI